MIESIRRLGQKGILFCERLGISGLFLLRVLIRRPKNLKSLRLLINEIYAVGCLSLVVIVISGIFIGMVLALQGYNILSRFSAEQELGQLIALSVTRELGPVVTALLFAGRAGTALSAEIGLMQATKQIASMEMMAVNPLARVIAPRFLAGFISMPVLAMIFNMVSVYGGSWVGVEWLGVDSGAFWSNMQTAVSFRVDVVNGIIKSFVFGFIVTWIAVYQGFYCRPTASGISQATTKTVVYASLAVLGLDFMLTAMMLKGW